MNKIKIHVLRYKSDYHSLTFSPTEIIPLSDIIKEKIDNVYLLPITDTHYKLVLYYSNIYYTIGIAVFDWQLKDEAIKPSTIAKIKEIKIRFTTGFEQYIKDLINQNKFITSLEIELLYQFGQIELGQQVKYYIDEWKIKQAEKEKREEEENRRKEQQEKEEEEQKELNNKWKKYPFVMEYIKNKKPLQQRKIWQQLIENAKFYKVDGKIISFYNMVEMYINTTVVEVEEYTVYKKTKGEVKATNKRELAYFPGGKSNSYYVVNKTQYDYIEWRLKQVNN